jgi:hypothetical protein
MYNISTAASFSAFLVSTVDEPWIWLTTKTRFNDAETKLERFTLLHRNIDNCINICMPEYFDSSVSCEWVPNNDHCWGEQAIDLPAKRQIHLLGLPWPPSWVIDSSHQEYRNVPLNQKSWYRLCNLGISQREKEVIQWWTELHSLGID